MRILHLISSVYFFGAERVVAELSAKQPKLGGIVHVGVLTVDDHLPDIFKAVIDNTDVSVVSFDGSGMLNFNTLRKIGRYIQENRIDIIHCHGYKSNIYALLAKQLTHSASCLVSTNHNWIGTTRREKIYQKIDALTLRFFKTIVAVSPDVRDQMLAAGIRPERITIIDNGIDVDDPEFQASATDARSRLGLLPDDFVIGNVARLTPEKAHSHLIEAIGALDELNHLKLVLVGDGPERGNLQKLVNTLGLEGKVILAGNRENARSLYAAFDVFALVSTNEGLPMVLLEAMAARVPVIASRVGSIPKVIDHRCNGILIPPMEKEKLCSALRELYRDDTLRRQLGEAARRSVVRSYSSSSMAAEYYTKYEGVTKRG